MRRLMSAVAAAAALAATGCSAERPGRSAYVRAGNAILCERGERVARAVTAQVVTGHEPTPAEEGALVLPALRRAYRDLDRLVVAPSERGRVRVLMHGYREALRTAEEHPERLAGDADPFGPVDRSFAAYGLDECT